MFWIFALGTLLVAEAFSAYGPLSVEENQRLQKTCGLVKVDNNSTVIHKGYLTDDATTKTAPWSVAVMYNGRQHCSASLISSRHVLTAAHCVMITYTVPFDVKSFTFVIDDDCGTTNGGCKLNETYVGRATKVFLPRDFAHPMRHMFDLSQYGDIAVFELVHEVNLTEHTVPVCLADSKASIGTEVDHFGYGDDPFNNNRTGRLQHLKTNVTSCDDYESKFTTDLDHLCTFSTSHPCVGDSGGGFIAEENGRNTVVGLVSHGDECSEYIAYPNQKELLDHNTAIAPHTKWICEKTGICLETSENQGEFYTGDVLTIYNNEIY